MALAYLRSFDPDEVASEDEATDLPIGGPAGHGGADVGDEHRGGHVSNVGPRRRPAPASMAELAARVTSVGAPSHQRTLALDPALVGLVGTAGLRRGTTVSVGGPASGATSVALALVAAATACGSWCALVGMTHLHAPAAAALGCSLARIVIVDAPEPGRWSVVVAALLDGLDVVVVATPARVGAGDARRLTARARERGSVLIVVEPGNAVLEAGLATAATWPEATDLRLRVDASSWSGLDEGAGHLWGRLIDARGGGRRAAAHERRVVLGLPGRSGRMEGIDTPRGVAAVAVDVRRRVG